MSQISVRHLDGQRFVATVRGHTITVDQPTDAGGADSAPTPTELFVAGLASCVGFYAQRYLVRHGLPATGLSVTTTYSLGSRPTRVVDIRVSIRVPDGVPAERRDALLAVASHCTVHNTLVDPPTVTVGFEDAASAA